MLFLVFVSNVGLFFYFRYFINPVLYYTAQEPVFFFDKHFFKEFLTFPGGLLEYTAALLSQFFYWPWLGALVLMAIFFLIFAAIRYTIKKTIQFDPVLFALLPMTLLLVMHNFCDHSLIVDLTLLFSLVFVYLYMSFNSRTARLFFLLFFGPLFYFVAGAAFLLFVFYALLFEILYKRNIIQAVIFILMAVALPFFSGTQLFLIPLQDAFVKPAISGSHITLNISLYLSVPVLAIMLFFLVRIKSTFFAQLKTVWLVALFLLLLMIFFGIPAGMLEKMPKKYWQINYSARTGDWQKLLRMCETPYPNTSQIVSQINRALSHTRQMGSRLFAYKQDFGLGGLFPMDETALSSPLIRSDIYFDLRHFNEAKHWAHEATSVTGETVWNLQRLAIVYLIYDQPNVARLYLNKLKKTIPLTRWAKQYERYLDDRTALKNDALIGPLLKNVVKENFLSFVENPMPDLPKLLRADPQNRIAFDYLMASLLLTKKLRRFVALLDVSNRSDPLPRYYQEALLFYVSQVRDHGLEIKSKIIEKETLLRFRAFQSTVQANRNDKRAAERQLAAQFSDTYWYYILFHVDQGT